MKKDQKYAIERIDMITKKAILVIESSKDLFQLAVANNFALLAGKEIRRISDENETYFHYIDRIGLIIKTSEKALDTKLKEYGMRQ